MRTFSAKDFTPDFDEVIRNEEKELYAINCSSKNDGSVNYHTTHKMVGIYAEARKLRGMM